jgi:benzoate-CoA ligase family protein
MGDHTVTLDTSQDPAGIEFSAVFNCAVPYIDRHLDEGRADKVFMRSATEEVTYAELAENVNRCGNALKGLGIGAGERVLMMIKDCAEFYYVFFGAIKAGIVPVPLNTLLKAKDYQFMIEDSECQGLVYSPEFATEVEAALSQANRKPPHVILTNGEGETMRALIDGASAALDAAPTTHMDDCFWLYSSGTTGTPKGTVHRHRDMPVSSQSYGIEVMGIGEHDVCFSAAKLFFAYGLGNALHFPLWVGASAVLFAGPPSPAATFETIEKFKPTLYFGVPTLYAAQLAAMDKEKPDLSSLRLCISAGEALPADIFRRWKENTGLIIMDGIGSTEATHIFISNRHDDAKPGASGKPVPRYEVRILDKDGNEVKAGDPGQLLIKCETALSRYWNNDEKTASTIVDGWLFTGDTYYHDEEGYYYYCGRDDDMMKVGGIWCSPFEIEATLVEHPKVLEAAVVGRADEEQLIKPEAFIVLTEGSEATDALRRELQEHCKSGLARYKYPRWFNFEKSLPKTATGKIQRYKLRQP